MAGEGQARERGCVTHALSRMGAVWEGGIRCGVVLLGVGGGVGEMVRVWRLEMIGVGSIVGCLPVLAGAVLGFWGVSEWVGECGFYIDC